jgi:hypothetical protein
MSMKNSNDTIGNRSRDLPVCSAVPQPLRHRVPHILVSRLQIYFSARFVILCHNARLTPKSDVHGSVHIGNVYVRLKVQLDVHGFICISLFLYIFAVHVSGAICSHPQEHKLQNTDIGVCNLWKAEVISSIKWCAVIFFICMNLWICVN